MNITGINHLTFATKNLGVSIAFYSKILGAQTLATWDTGAYLLLGKLWLCLSLDENTKSEPNAEYSHIALDISEADFHKIKTIVAKNNVPIWKENKSEGESLYILDPDFNKLEIHASNLKNRLQAMMQKPYPGMQLNHDLIKTL